MGLVENQSRMVSVLRNLNNSAVRSKRVFAAGFACQRECNSDEAGLMPNWQVSALIANYSFDEAKKMRLSKEQLNSKGFL